MRKPIPWPQLFVEAGLVVLSLLLALALNSWREGERHEELAEQALRNIEAEILANQATLEEAQGYHAMLLDRLAEDAGQGMPLKPAIIRNNAWETAQATEAVTYLDYDLAALVSEIHELQEIYQQIGQAAMQALYFGISSGRPGNPTIRPIAVDLHDIEQRLLDKYTNLLNKI